MSHLNSLMRYTFLAGHNDLALLSYTQSGQETFSQQSHCSNSSPLCNHSHLELLYIFPRSQKTDYVNLQTF